MGLSKFFNIGKDLKAARKNKGFSQKEMAKLLDIPISTYSGYENNHREPSYETLKNIYLKLGVTPWYLFFNEEYKQRHALLDLIISCGYHCEEFVEDDCDYTSYFFRYQNNAFTVSSDDFDELSDTCLGFIDYQLELLYKKHMKKYSNSYNKKEGE